MRLDAERLEFESFLAAATGYWRANVLPAGDDDPLILVEAMHQDFRVTLRNLTVANALRRLFPAHLVVLTGTDEDWHSALWSAFDVELFREVSTAFGAVDVIDIHELVDQHVRAGGSQPFTVAGRSVTLASQPSIDPESLRQNVVATTCRVKQVPRLIGDPNADPEFRRLFERSSAFSTFYDAIIESTPSAAVITSHVDYNQWGLLVESGQRHDVPVVHVQSTGSLKAYCVFPDQRRGLESYRAELTASIGDWFEQHVWAAREQLEASAELVAWRAKSNLGRPSWWRGGDAGSADLQSDQERADLRVHALHRLRFDPALPVVVVFNHAVSDALGTNRECFADVATWFEETVRWSRNYDGANWLFLDHPSQALYDTSGFFAGLTSRYEDDPRTAFLPSPAIGKNILWSLCDLGVTVRGSVSNELPAYGIPVLQAGWSEWSSCGLSLVAQDRDDYWKLLESTIERLAAGERILTDEQVRRGRLWTWFYRCGADVASSLVPHWEFGSGDELMRWLVVAMRHVESDGDPAFAAVERMWKRREPFLTRFDMELPVHGLSGVMGAESPA